MMKSLLTFAAVLIALFAYDVSRVPIPSESPNPIRTRLLLYTMKHLSYTRVSSHHSHMRDPANIKEHLYVNICNTKESSQTVKKCFGVSEFKKRKKAVWTFLEK